MFDTAWYYLHYTFQCPLRTSLCTSCLYLNMSSQQYKNYIHRQSLNSILGKTVKSKLKKRPLILLKCVQLLHYKSKSTLSLRWEEEKLPKKDKFLPCLHFLILLCNASYMFLFFTTTLDITIIFKKLPPEKDGN